MFYYLLGNISPQFRSQLKAIQLVCVAPALVVKSHGIDAVLEPFVEDMKLEKVDCGQACSSISTCAQACSSISTFRA